MICNTELKSNHGFTDKGLRNSGSFWCIWLDFLYAENCICFLFSLFIDIMRIPWCVTLLHRHIHRQFSYANNVNSLYNEKLHSFLLYFGEGEFIIVCTLVFWHMKVKNFCASHVFTLLLLVLQRYYTHHYFINSYQY